MLHHTGKCYRTQPSHTILYYSIVFFNTIPYQSILYHRKTQRDLRDCEQNKRRSSEQLSRSKALSCHMIKQLSLAVSIVHFLKNLVCGKMLTRPYYIANYTAQPHFVFLRNTSRIRADDPREHKNVGFQNNSSDPTADWQATHEFRTASFTGKKATFTKVVSCKGRSPTKCHTPQSSSCFRNVFWKDAA